MMSSKGRSLFMAILLIGGVVATTMAGMWFHYHPRIVEKTVTLTQTIEKTLPCPPSKTGSVTVDGKGNVGNSGNDVHINDPNDKK